MKRDEKPASPNHTGRTFDHERLDVYQLALECVDRLEVVAGALPRYRGYLALQLRRAASSVALSVGEGAGEYSRDEKRRFYRMVLRSASECAAALDVIRRLHCIDPARATSIKSGLERVAAMLTKMCK